jgi:hypothetical protein
LPQGADGYFANFLHGLRFDGNADVLRDAEQLCSQPKLLGGFKPPVGGFNWPGGGFDPPGDEAANPLYSVKKRRIGFRFGTAEKPLVMAGKYLAEHGSVMELTYSD